MIPLQSEYARMWVLSIWSRFSHKKERVFHLCDITSNTTVHLRHTMRINDKPHNAHNNHSVSSRHYSNLRETLTVFTPILQWALTVCKAPVETEMKARCLPSRGMQSSWEAGTQNTAQPAAQRSRVTDPRRTWPVSTPSGAKRGKVKSGKKVQLPVAQKA